MIVMPKRSVALHEPAYHVPCQASFQLCKLVLRLRTNGGKSEVHRLNRSIIDSRKHQVGFQARAPNSALFLVLGVGDGHQETHSAYSSRQVVGNCH